MSAGQRRIFSGIQPTGRKHLGNYIGAIRQYVEGQESADADAGELAIYCIVDLHAITVAYDPAELRERVHDTTAILLAAGLDSERCVLFRQGDVREHTELCWLLGGVTAWGDLNRMTPVEGQARADRAADGRLRLRGPLQLSGPAGGRRARLPRDRGPRRRRPASAHRADPRGRPPLQRALRPDPRRARARDPRASAPGSWTSRTRPARCRRPPAARPGRVYVLDEPDAIRKKFRSAVTDSGREVRRGGPDGGKEGIENLIEILCVVRGIGPEEIEAEFEGKGYGDFKAAVGDAVADYLAPVRERYAELRVRPRRDRAHACRRGREGPRDRRAGPRRRPRSDGRRRAALAGSGGVAPHRPAARLVFNPCAPPTSSSTSTSSPGRSTCCSRSSSARRSACSKSSSARSSVAYMEHLDDEGELDLEAATEFLVLIAALLELKSRLMLPAEEEPELDLGPEEAADELLARMLEYRRYKDAGAELAAGFAENGPTCTARRRCRSSCAGSRSRPRGRPTTPTASASRSATC